MPVRAVDLLDGRAHETLAGAELLGRALLAAALLERLLRLLLLPLLRLLGTLTHDDLQASARCLLNPTRLGLVAHRGPTARGLSSPPASSRSEQTPLERFRLKEIPAYRARLEGVMDPTELEWLTAEGAAMTTEEALGAVVAWAGQAH